MLVYNFSDLEEETENHAWDDLEDWLCHWESCVLDQRRTNKQTGIKRLNVNTKLIYNTKWLQQTKFDFYIWQFWFTIMYENFPDIELEMDPFPGCQDGPSIGIQGL